MDGTKKNLIFGKEIEKLVRDSHNVIYFQYMLQKHKQKQNIQASSHKYYQTLKQKLTKLKRLIKK